MAEETQRSRPLVPLLRTGADQHGGRRRPRVRGRGRACSRTAFSSGSTPGLHLIPRYRQRLKAARRRRRPQHRLGGRHGLRTSLTTSSAPRSRSRVGALRVSVLGALVRPGAVAQARPQPAACGRLTVVEGLPVRPRRADAEDAPRARRRHGGGRTSARLLLDPSPEPLDIPPARRAVVATALRPPPGTSPGCRSHRRCRRVTCCSRAPSGRSSPNPRRTAQRPRPRHRAAHRAREDAPRGADDAAEPLHRAKPALREWSGCRWMP